MKYYNLPRLFGLFSILGVWDSSSYENHDNPIRVRDENPMKLPLLARVLPGQKPRCVARHISPMCSQHDPHGFAKRLHPKSTGHSHPNASAGGVHRSTDLVAIKDPQNGKLTFCYGKSQFFIGKQLFLWQFSISNCLFTRYFLKIKESQTIPT